MHCISILINFLPLFWEFAFLYFYFYFEKKYSWTLNTRMDLNWILSKCLKTHFFHRQWILVLLQKKICFYDNEGKIKQIDRIESIVWQRLKRNSHTYKFFPCPYVAWIMHQVPFCEMSQVAFLQGACDDRVWEVVCNCISWASPSFSGERKETQSQNPTLLAYG